MKSLSCKDAGYDCNVVIQGATDEEVLQKAGEHAAKDHNLQITPELAAKVKALIKEVQS